MADRASRTCALVSRYPCTSAPPPPLIYILYIYIGKDV